MQSDSVLVRLVQKDRAARILNGHVVLVHVSRPLVLGSRDPAVIVALLNALFSLLRDPDVQDDTRGERQADLAFLHEMGNQEMLDLVFLGHD